MLYRMDQMFLPNVYSKDVMYIINKNIAVTYISWLQKSGKYTSSAYNNQVTRYMI